MTTFILLLTAFSLELANNDGEIKADTNNVVMMFPFIPLVLINDLHNKRRQLCFLTNIVLY